MKGVIENLEAVLRHIAGVYSKLLEEGEAKREAIIKGDIQALEEILDREYELLDIVKKAEGMRVVLAGQAEDEFGIDQDKRPLKLSELVAIVGESGNGLADAQSILKDVLTKFRYRNRQNEELLKSSIAHVNDFMTLIKDRAGKNKTYNKSGRDYGGGLSLFDKRA